MRTDILKQMALGAVGFAENDIAVATRIVQAGIKDPRGNKIRCKYAAKRLRSAMQQLKAAAILLENDDE